MKVNSKKEGFSYYHSIIGVLIGAVFGCFVIIGYIQYVKLSEFNDPIFNMGIERNMKEFIKNEIHYFRGNSKSNAVPNENKEVINGRNMGADANPDRDKKTQDGKHNAVGRYIVDAEIESNTKNRRIVENLYEIRNNLISSGKMVDNKEQPIDDTVTHVIQCSTSLGNITMDIRKNWAPFGVKRFLSMLEKDFFNDLSFFRVAPRYITQFGAKYREPNSITNTLNCQSFEDDRSMWNVRDMDMGYIFFAGSGINSRGCQMVFSLCEMGGCKQTTLGSTPWEVPIGTIRKDGFNVLRDIGQTGFPYPKLEMQGQHKDAAGPNQELIRKDKNYLKETYPDMAYFRHCRMVQEDVSLYRPIVIDHPETTYGISSQSNGKSKLLLPDIENIRKLGTFKPHIYVEFVVGITADSTLSNNAGEGVEISESEYILIFEIFPDWAPLGASRFLELVFDGYFDNNVFFRVIKGFIAQFGISTDNTDLTKSWMRKPIQDDIDSSADAKKDKERVTDSSMPMKSNTRGTLAFASSGPNTRSCQMFINLANNAYLDKQGFTPIGKLIYGGSTTIDRIYSGYGEGGKGDGTDGRGPNQHVLLQKTRTVEKDGVREAFNSTYYTILKYPKLSRIITARII